jgi:hypothetical protein
MVHNVNDTGTHFLLAHHTIQFKSQYKMGNGTAKRIFTVQSSLLCICRRTVIGLEYIEGNVQTDDISDIKHMRHCDK